MNNITILRFTIKVQRFTERFIIFFLICVICNAAIVGYKNKEIIKHNGLIILSITFPLAIARYSQKENRAEEIARKIIGDELFAPLGIALIFGLSLIVL